MSPNLVINVSHNFRKTEPLLMDAKGYREADVNAAKVMDIVDGLSKQMPKSFFKYLCYKKTGEDESNVSAELCFGEVPLKILHAALATARAMQSSGVADFAAMPERVVVVFSTEENKNEFGISVHTDDELKELLQDTELVATTNRRGEEVKAFFEMTFAELEGLQPSRSRKRVHEAVDTAQEASAAMPPAPDVGKVPLRDRSIFEVTTLAPSD